MIKYVSKKLLTGVVVFLLLWLSAVGLSSYCTAKGVEDEIFIETDDWAVMGIERWDMSLPDGERKYVYHLSYKFYDGPWRHCNINVPPLNAETIREAVEADIRRGQKRER